MKQQGQPPIRSTRKLRAINGGRRAATADEILREGARLYADYITRRLADVDESEQARVAAAAERLRLLAG